MRSVLRAGAFAAALAAIPWVALGADQQPAPKGDATGEWKPIPADPGPGPAPAAGEVEKRAPPAEGQAAASSTAPQGVWVHTQQHGWLWLPYGRQYVYSPPGATEPLAYVYGPSLGWAWVGAPWLWGSGPAVTYYDPYPYGASVSVGIGVGAYWGWGGYWGYPYYAYGYPYYGYGYGYPYYGYGYPYHHPYGYGHYPYYGYGRPYPVAPAYGARAPMWGPGVHGSGAPHGAPYGGAPAGGARPAPASGAARAAPPRH